MAMLWLVFLPALLAGLIQGLTGFGSAIIMMIFLPAILPIGQGAGVATLVMAASVITLVYRYRHDIHLRRIILPFIIYASVATWSIHLTRVWDVHRLRLMLGILLVCLAIYFLWSKSAGDRRYPWPVAIGFMLISGFFNGLFGIGGPLMALYFLSLSDSTDEYLASIETFFLFDTIYVTSVRVATGVLVASNIPLILLGMVGATTGTIIAAHLLNHLDINHMKRGIYLFIGLSGLYYLFF